MTPETPYRRHPHPGVLTFQWTAQDNGDERELTVTGTCPVCQCAMAHSFGPIQPLIAKGGNGFLGRRKAPIEPDVWNMSCACESYHQPRPAQRRGCGALLTLAPPPARLTTGS
ncbi:hypothetical protein PV729_17630 [Streptomyces europaeiscabiei]|uniref:Uncharacterized protein n=1 Tax=Streptomyces europaeiscabiei TaxID=146819 RepID=A0ABU4NFM9_9ACTN|nr:hypothetical protein [Streptomyces europaeiscabiei]MDX2771765.1 hypothetical protein [Streptomyces europaeiscabiei]MDX3543598.1 hypothetical protein [Streptomyces europaeiscabiei]MDX3553565.1 hypothetical protein [Streptomyces europaeiscabiei]MDX3689059.1 hypothetical protein [Streptomyces europaeiscabiei]MDX3701531.1 hypothetical protein [Streptomyces europaeiscabiei]